LNRYHTRVWTGDERMQKDGLGEPEDVRNSLAVWKSEDDFYKEFFEDECIFDAEKSAPKRDMWMRFQSWAEQNGIRYPSRDGLNERLRARGCSEVVERHRPEGKQVRCWKGVQVV
jgi:hypothetical protein